ncbi:MAG: hypothetical protein E7470_08660 [Ruminococcaceae bacterium]|nr:hypothetical protein [Oscillospiraceae bacterium]
MICLLNGIELYLRAQNWSAAEDFVWRCSLVNINWWAGNHYFNIEAGYTCPKTDAPDAIGHLSLWKEAHDDICPLAINGTFVGGNHGMDCVDVITAPAHGKTKEDIGSVWLDSKDRTYCLVKIPNANTLWFVMFDDASMARGIMGCGEPQGMLRHQQNAMHTEDVIIEAWAEGQLRPCYNHYQMRLFVDGKRVDPYQDLVQECRCVSVEKEYDVIYVPAMLQMLMDRVGKNDNASMHAEQIRERYVRVCVRYDFHDNGSTSVYVSYQFAKDVELRYLGLVQSMTVNDVPFAYAYVPDTVYETPVQQQATTTIRFEKDAWNDTGKVPYRYYQFKDEACRDGMALVYDRSYGWGSNETRLANVTYAGWYNHRTRKQYPAFISGGKLKAGTQVDGFAARIPVNKRDPDLTALCWYYIGDDIVLMIDTHKAVEKDILLPDCMAGRKMELMDSKGAFDVALKEDKLHVRFDGYGYLVVRLSK